MDIEELGRRIGKLETAQALVLGRLDSLAVQFGEAMAESQSHNRRLDDHETRLRLREVAYQERILPALERLRNLELKVAGSAFVGGGLIVGLIEVVKYLNGA